MTRGSWSAAVVMSRRTSDGGVQGWRSNTSETARARTATSARAAHGRAGCQPARWATASFEGVVTVISNAPSMARRTSPMSRTRCLGSFCRQPRRNVVSSGGVSVGSAPQFGSRCSTLDKVSETSSPSKTLLPVSISKSTTPNAQTSARLSAVFPRACSGDIYAAVPMITPIWVAAAVSVGHCEGSPVGLGFERLCEPEVQDLHGPVLAHLDVGGLQVTVNDSRFMRGPLTPRPSVWRWGAPRRAGSGLWKCGQRGLAPPLTPAPGPGCLRLPRCRGSARCSDG